MMFGDFFLDMPPTATEPMKKKVVPASDTVVKVETACSPADMLSKKLVAPDGAHGSRPTK